MTDQAAELLAELKDEKTYRNVEKRIRADLMRFADAFIDITKIPDATIGRTAFNDSAYLLKVRNGSLKRITAEKYDALLDYFERALTEHIQRSSPSDCE